MALPNIKDTDRGFNIDKQPKAVQAYISILESNLAKLREGIAIMGGVEASKIQVQPWNMLDPTLYLPDHTQIRFYLDGKHNNITCRIAQERKGDVLRVDSSRMLTIEPIASNVVECSVRQLAGGSVRQLGGGS